MDIPLNSGGGLRAESCYRGAYQFPPRPLRGLQLTSLHFDILFFLRSLSHLSDYLGLDSVEILYKIYHIRLLSEY